MKTGTASERLPIARIAVKGSCPVCAAVKHFQESLPGQLRTEGQTQLCNFHAWLLAKSASAEVAASLFLERSQSQERDAASASTSSCIVCEKIDVEEVARLKEVTCELERNTLDGRVVTAARAIRPRHVSEVKKQVPDPCERL